MTGKVHSFKQRFTDEMKLARELSMNSGKILLSSFRRRKDIIHKGTFNLITDIDEASERAIIAGIRRAYPHDSILTEESEKRDDDPDRRWLIDPLDGTNNYAHNFPFFSVSIAFEYFGRIVLGVVYNPLTEELFSAVKDNGAYLNQRLIKVSHIDRLSDALLSTGFPYDRLEGGETNLEFFGTFLMKAQGLRRTGSAALDLCFVASGRVDAFWELKLSPWDTASGALIVTEAGGKVTCLDGSEWNPHLREVLASNTLLHEQMVAVARTVPRGLKP